ncbi:hypothetical protein Nmel_006095, partial [Mimus melanotis]
MPDRANKKRSRSWFSCTMAFCQEGLALPVAPHVQKRTARALQPGSAGHSASHQPAEVSILRV